MTVINPTSPWHPKRLARTAAFVLGAVAIAVAAFLAVLHFQPAVAPAGPTPDSSPSVAIAQPDSALHHGMGPIDKADYKSYQDGKLVSEFIATDLTPRKDGTIDVLRPEAKFYLKNGQYLHVTGDTGRITFPSTGGSDKGGGMLATGTKMPDTGTLHHVHIGLFPFVGAPAPTLTMDTDNVRFDNDVLRLYTERIPATATGPEVAADMVPVVVRGADYDMDGTGLTLRLSAGANSRDRQLHLLEIAHGNRLTIMHPAALGSHNGPKVVAVPVMGPALVSASAADVPLALPPKTMTSSGPQVYRAVFNDQIRIAEGDPSTAGRLDRTIGLGDVLTLDFSQKRDATTKPTTDPAVVATTKPAPGTAATQSAALATTRPTVATTKPAKLGEEPITIYWTGKLLVTPWEPAATMMPLDAGQAAVRLAGRPAMLTYNGATAHAAVATYRTPDDAVRLEPSAECPVVHLSQPAKGMTVDARSVDYDPATSVATIAGPATLHVTEAGSRTTMTATWADRGLLHVLDAGRDPGGVDAVDLSGDVHADDPRFSLASRRLLLDLDPTKPTARPGERSETHLRRLTAVGYVVCRLLHPGHPDEGIEGDRLVIGMVPGPGGRAVPRTVSADGRQVHAFTADQALYADHLEALLVPKPPSTQPTTRLATTRPTDDVALESMYASGHVRAALKGGETAVADTLRETTGPDGRQYVELAAAGGAHVTRVTPTAHDEMVGSVIHMTDKDNSVVVVVDGPGTLHTVSKPTTRPAASSVAVASGKPTTRPAGGIGGTPIDVSWTDGLSFDSVANTADVVGHVVVRSTEANGTVNHAVGDKAHIDFVAVPQAKTKSTTRNSTDGGFGNREVKVLTLVGHMQAESELDVGGSVVRYGQLNGERLVYTAEDHTARVPGTGTLFIENHRLPTTGPAAGHSPTGGKFGTTAVVWQGGLAYNELTDVIHIVGDVRVGFLQDGAKPADGGPMKMRSDDQVIVMKRPAAGKDGDPQPIQTLTATGGVHMTTRSLVVDCHQVVLTPDRNLMVAIGSDAEPGRAVDTGGKSVGGAGGGFGRLEYDTNQNAVTHVDGVNGSFRR